MSDYADFVDQYLRDNDKELHSFMGLASESGEVLDLYKKERIYGVNITKEEYIDELGDVMFYLQGICNHLKITFDEIKDYNTIKLMERYGSNPTFTEKSPDGKCKRQSSKKRNPR